jgi:hypothetical protein
MNETLVVNISANFTSSSVNNHIQMNNSGMGILIEDEHDFDFNRYIKFRLLLSWLSLIVCLIGLVGNLMSFIVLISEKMRIATNVFLASLCVSGFIALLGLLVNSVTYDLLICYELQQFLFYILASYPYVYPVITTFQMASILLTVCVSVNQFACIYFSRLKSHTKRTVREDCRTASKIVFLMFLFSIIYCIPYWLKFRFTLKKGLEETELARNPLFRQLVHFWAYLPIAYIIPFSILIITNTYLIGTLMLARKRRHRLNLVPNNNRRRVNSSIPNDEKKKNSQPLITMTTSPIIGSQMPQKKNLLVIQETINLIECGIENSNEENKSESISQNIKRKKKSHLYGGSLSSLPFIKLPRFDISVSKVTNSEGVNVTGNNVISKRDSLAATHALNTSPKTFRNKTSSISITIMLIAVVFLFFICQFPVLVLHVVQSMWCTKNPFSCELSGVYNYCRLIAKFLLICNLSFNFACYCLFNEKFREVFREKFFCLWWPTRNNHHKLTFKIIL